MGGKGRLPSGCGREREGCSLRPDMTVPCGEGLINLRVGAIIQRDGRILMVANPKADYLYSVGGRIQFGETAEEAVIREVLEETGCRMAVDRLGFIHENYFYGDNASNRGKVIYEVSFFFYMRVPPDFRPVCGSETSDGAAEFLRWIDPQGPDHYYPDFFRTALADPRPGVRHFVTDDR